MKTVVIVPDVHLDTTIPKPYQNVKKFIRDIKPDEVVLLGDFMDIQSFSAWDLDKKRLMENRRYVKETNLANKELDYLQKYTKKITYLMGNHEDRVERYLDKHPEMEGYIEIDKVLNLNERGIKSISFNQLYKIGDLYFTHGLYYNKYYAQKTLDNLGCNIVVGHLHKPQTAFTTAKMCEARMCWGLGCLCGKEPAYMKGRPSNWNNGFGVAYIKDSGHFSMYSIHMSEIGNFIYNGKEYGGKKNE